MTTGCVPGWLSAPIEVTCELTAACNLACKYCYAEAGIAQEPELTTAEWLALLEQVASLGVFTVFLGGGEPLLHPGFFEIASRAQKLRLTAAVSTNGTLITDEVARQLAEARVAPVQVSLDGANPEVHGFLSGRESAFRQCIRGLEFAARHNLPVQLAVTLTTVNLNQIEPMVNLARHFGISSVFFSAVLGPPAQDPMLMLSREQEQMACLTVEALQTRNQEVLLVFTGTSYSSLSDPEQSLNAVDQVFSPCPAGRVRLVVSPSGNVFPCEFLRSPSVVAGNVRAMSLREIWDGSEIFRSFRRTFSGRSCANCSLLATR